MAVATFDGVDLLLLVLAVAFAWAWCWLIGWR